MIGIRTDMNENIASGHLMRCLTIAEQLKIQQQEVLFIGADGNGRALTEQAGFAFVNLHSAWNHMEEELERLEAVLQEYDIELLLIDSYSVTPVYMERLAAKVRLAYLDDEQLFNYPVSLLVNDALDAGEELYPASKARLLLGGDYAPLRSEFAQGRIAIAETVMNIMITTGGSDPYHIAYGLARKLLSENLQYRLHIVAGRFFDNVEQLQQLAAQYGRERVHIYEKVQRMSDVMKCCDLAVSAGGTTLAELCAMGVPTVAFAFAQNQIAAAEGFARRGWIVYAGSRLGAYDKKELPEEPEESAGNETSAENAFLEAVLEGIRALESREKRCRMAERAASGIDGQGAKRIAAAICELLSEQQRKESEQ